MPAVSHSLRFSTFLPALSKAGDEDVVMDPCTPRGYVFKRNSLVSEVTNDPNVQDAISAITAAGNFSECRRAALALLQRGRGMMLNPSIISRV